MANVAIDLGAESCRVSLLQRVRSRPQITLVHRFANAPIAKHGSLYWDIERIYNGIQEGLRISDCVADEQVKSVGIDGWAVDYVRIRPDGATFHDPFCYRDERTVEAHKDYHLRLPPETLYNLTGVQILRFNTLYQLCADLKAGIPPHIPWINLPEYITCRLGAERFAEYTNATHTGLVELTSRGWCKQVFDAGNLSMQAAPPIVPTGTPVGAIAGELAALPRLYGAKLIAPACHDTASAIAGIPDKTDEWAFVSSGTWSLVGVLLDAPCVGSQSFEANFTNLGGVGNKICFLKNVNGMWLLRQCLELWESAGHKARINEVVAAAETLPAPRDLLDVDEPSLLMPGNILEKINNQLTEAGSPPLSEESSDLPVLANLIFHSLAARYARVLEDIRSITGRKFRRLYIVGGGNKNRLLNRLTSEYSGLMVLRGSSESATIGNLATQLASLEEGDAVTGVPYASVASWAKQLCDSAIDPPLHEVA
jgi:rhamnulokinase